MVLWTKLWYYTENYRTSIYEEKKHCRLPNTEKLWFILEQTMEIYQNNWSLEQTYSLRTLIYYEKTMVLWKKNYGTLGEKLWLYYTENFGTLIYYGKNYGTMEKTMVLYRKLWNFDLLWKKLWYYGKNYGTIVNYSKL